MQPANVNKLRYIVRSSSLGSIRGDARNQIQGGIEAPVDIATWDNVQRHLLHRAQQETGLLKGAVRIR